VEARETHAEAHDRLIRELVADDPLLRNFRIVKVKDRGEHLTIVYVRPEFAGEGIRMPEPGGMALILVERPRETDPKPVRARP
jgi:hypothetical protein